MQTVELKQAPELARIIRAVDSTYRKKNAFMRAQSECSLHGTYWDGGSRTTYTAVNLATLQTGAAEQYAPPQFGGPAQAPTVSIPDGVAIVATGVFCGKSATATVYVNPRNLSMLIDHK